jgi:hypothetical protein
MRKIWDKIVAWILAIPTDKKLHFVAGFIIAAFFGLALGMKAIIVPALFAGFIKEFFDLWTTQKWEWWDFAATCFGGLLAQLFVVLNMWWF